MKKGYRTPSWFRAKERLKDKQAKAQSGKLKAPKTKKGKRETDDSPASGFV